MVILSQLPPELILHIVSFITRETLLDPKQRLRRRGVRYRPDLRSKRVPDLPSINALSQANVALHCTLDQTLYRLCASVERLGSLALLFAVEQQLENTFDKLITAGVPGNPRFEFNACCHGGLLHIAAWMGLRGMVVKLLGIYDAIVVHARNGSNHTALDYAALNGHMEVVRLLAPFAYLALMSSTGPQNSI
ncbi:hypothetical protein K438DRAFT_1265777 [Mycena galopus ATCC 62051]|nr:hypothetical protein K438DRAFT_1265777 [Mycena galopus ATCC 62051]